MRIRPALRVFLVAGVMFLGGCATRTPLIATFLEPELPRVVELESTPFFPQERYQCGPAALATVLVASGVAVKPEELVDRVYLPARGGSLQTELIAASRGYDRLAYRLDPHLDALLAELAAGRPVLVLQNLGVTSLPVWHYAVVMGFDAADDRVLLRSGTTQRLSMPARRFLSSWQRAQSWALVLLAPGHLPARPERDRYVQAAVGLEAAGRYPAALAAYRTALERWPDATTARLGIGNVEYRRGNLATAADEFAQLLTIDPAHAVARNNLAQVLLERGQPEAALREITAARASLRDARFAPLLEKTEAEIRRVLATDAPARNP